MLAARAALVSLLVVVAVALRPSSAAPATTQTPDDGRLLYQRDCAFCHGDNGEGTTRGPSIQSIGAAEVDYAVSTGRMPVKDPDTERERRPPKYSRPEIDALLTYLEPVIAGGPDIPEVDPARGDRARGGEVFRAECASCHQWAGVGGALLSLEAPALHQATPTQIGDAVRSGPVDMPAFSPASIDDAELDDLAAYVLYLRHPEDRGGWHLWHLGPFAEGLLAWGIGMVLLILGVNWIGERE